MDGPLSGRPELQAEGRFDGASEVTVPWTSAAGGRYVLVLEQRDVDAELAIRDASGRERLRVAGPARGLGREIAAFDPRVAEPLAVTVRVRGRPARDAGYALEIHRLPDDTPETVHDAFVRMTRAGAAAADPGADGADAIVADYVAAEKVWRGRDARLAADAALQSAATDYWLRDAWTPAIDATQRSIKALQRVDAPATVADATVLAGLAKIELARERRGADAEDARRLLAAGEADFARARSAYARAQRPVAAATTQVYEGTARYYAYDLAGAVEKFTAAEAALERLGAADERTLVLGNLAGTSADRGDYAAAARVYDRLLETATGDRSELRASIVVNSAGVLLYTGETQRALARYLDLLQFARETGSPEYETLALFGLGLSHLYLGQPDVATTHLEAVLERLRDTDRHTRVLALLRLGDARRALRDVTRAEAAHREAATLAAALGAPALRARVAVARAEDQMAATRYPAAIRAYSDALALPVPEANAIVARALVGRGRARRLAGDLPGAGEDLVRAAALTTASGHREERIAATLEQAELAARRGDGDAALGLATVAANGIRDLTGSVTNPDGRVTLSVRLRAARDLRVRLLAEAANARRAAGDDAGARARALSALLATDEARDTGAGTGPAAHSRTDDERRTLTETLAARRLRLETLAERNATPTPTMLAIEREVAELRSRLARIGAAPRPGAGAPPRVDVATLQARVPAGSALIVYSLGAERSWRWTVSRDRFDLDALPPAREIDRSVGQLLDAVRALHAPERALAAARTLGARIVPPNLPAGTRRLVVPDGSLGAVPWGLLGDEASPTLQLASLANLVEPSSPGPPWAPPTRLALFGDPVFGPDDPRTRVADSERVATASGRVLPRLAGTARELAAIANLAAVTAPGGPVAKLVTGPEATRDAVVALPRGGVDVLHLATHATLDAEVPELAAIVLSRRDAAGRALSADLRPEDIARLAVAAPLVVLSACDAAAEPSRSAAGLMNLTRAFLADGSRYVVASRWAVGDASAVALMTEFYRGLLVLKLAPDAALAHAQRTLAATPQWRAPFHWAGFVVTGIAP